MLIRLCISLLQSYDTKEPKTKFLCLEFFRGGGDNLLIINTMKNLFLLIFHPSDYQVVRRMIKQHLGKRCKILILCMLQTQIKKTTDKRLKRYYIHQINPTQLAKILLNLTNLTYLSNILKLLNLLKLPILSNSRVTFL